MPKSIDDKRTEAKARQEEYDKMSPKDKLKRLEQKGIKSGKEFTKLSKLAESK
jgi:hypothetical protein